MEVIRNYSYGIFRGEPHPVPKRKEAKHNPLQRLTLFEPGSAISPDTDDFRLSVMGIQFLVRLGDTRLLS